MIMAIEDLHWIDKSSEETSGKSFEGVFPGHRVFLILTYRTEFMHTWGVRSYHSQVNLNRLSNRESLAMMIHILGTDDIEPDYENFVLEKTEGIPLFLLKNLYAPSQDLKVVRKCKTMHLSIIRKN